MNLDIPIGGALLAIGLVLAAWRFRRRLTARRASGKVIRVDIVTTKDGEPHPSQRSTSKVQFADSQGAIRFFSSEDRAERRKLGDIVPVLYSPSDPQHAWIDDLGIYVLPIVLGALGLVLPARGLRTIDVPTPATIPADAGMVV
eukprot:gene31803-36466_t